MESVQYNPVIPTSMAVDDNDCLLCLSRIFSRNRCKPDLARDHIAAGSVDTQYLLI
ncbi:hypothetical protein [Glaciecola sp. 33A]|uniref:hypothetical protein n=1 Tax=Glaciecola sp. 33A TaxID=2057807 RepID=UPI0012FEBF43|nr:hypothetical protein [Glaciecola sp. 33A]